ncbi:type VI secretion system lipoprotein TssJ [Zoogloea dura]|jgi:type VI secretion system protein VasD|uniref:Type VI secretion system lipoprotein TssJ n=1 Tax=Zoogloea dura TaxID=2728840 RepID=A0A848G0A7_9RHOO|nr:type VI secretion system lipoprotein TssJ [Zoogloea dura]NML24744.1 type VI secretion system lipoprotein TssJ [Zoogloea dura]
MWKPFKTGCQLGLCIALSACGGSKPQIQIPELPPTVVQLTLQADAAVNQDSRGRPTPVVVRYYLLSHPASFEAADFFSLFDADEKTLGATSVQREEITLRPGESVKTILRPGAEVKSIGVFVAYRDPNRSVWRAVAPIQRNMLNTLQAKVGRDSVSIGPQR